MAVRKISSGVQQPGLATTILSSLFNPVRKTLGSGIEAGFNIGEKLGMGNADQMGIKNPFLSTQETKNVRNSPITESAKNIAGIGSYFVPIPAGGFRAAFLPGAASGVLSAISQDNVTLEDLMKAGVFGGTTAGVLNKLLSGSRGLSKAGEKLEEAGSGARQRVLKPQVSSTPRGPAEEKAALALQEKIGISGTGRQQWEQVGARYEQLNKQIKPIIESSNQTINKNLAKSKLESIVRENPNFISGESRYESTLEKWLTKFTNRANGDAAGAKSFFDFKNELAGQLKNAFRKASGDLNTPLSDQEQVGLALWEAVDQGLTDLVPDLKPLTKAQSELYSISPGLKKSSEATMQIPITGGRVSTAPIQAIQDTIGRNMISTGRTLQGTGIPAAPDILRQLITRAGASAAGGMQATQDTIPQQQTASPLTQTSDAATMQQPDSQQILKQLLAAGIVSGDISSSDVTALQELGLLGGGAEKALTESQQARSDVGSLSSQALRMLDSGSIKTGPLSPRFENLKAVFNAGDPSTIEFNSLVAQLRATIAKARAGTSFTANEEKLLNQYTPQVGDSDQVLRTKLTLLQQQFGAR